jgi:hypothetical protein
MKPISKDLLTPIYLKTGAETECPPADRAGYMLSSNGLYLCRNHPFFRSSVPARDWPSELASHSPMLELSHPKLSRRRFETIVGFFASVGTTQGAEAAAILLWDENEGEVKLLIPQQEATVSEGWSGRPYPIDLHYDLPTQLSPGQSIIGDIHSHVEYSAYSSAKDRHDETHRPGAHIVVGRISQEPPEIHCEYVVDGYRFEIDPYEILEGYRKRRDDFPREWVGQVGVHQWTWKSGSRSGAKTG